MIISIIFLGGPQQACNHNTHKESQEYPNDEAYPEHKSLLGCGWFHSYFYELTSLYFELDFTVVMLGGN
jgi:hypothetical protein